MMLFKQFAFKFYLIYRNLSITLKHRYDFDLIAQYRVIFVILFFLFSFLILSYRLLFIAGNSHVTFTRYNDKSVNFRNEIIDRNGHLLAASIPSSSLFVNPHQLLDPKHTIDQLCSILPNLDKQKLLREFNSDKKFVWVQRDLTPNQQDAIFNLGIIGLGFEHEQKRIYPFNNLASHLIGYVNRDLEGIAGIEKSYNNGLSNNDKQKLELSIDIRLQDILSEELNNIIKKFDAQGAVGIVADPNNGEILAMVSKPDFDINSPGKAKANQLFNMASLGVYEIGSVFKALTMAIGLDTNIISMHDVYDISYMKVGGFAIKDYAPKQGWHTVPEIFLHSSNIGVSQIMLEIGKDNLWSYFKKFGLLDRTNIEIPERGSPLYRHYAKWDDLTLVTMSYGYGLSVTPLNFMQAMLPLVNGGYAYPVTLLKRKEKTEGIRVLKQSTSDQMKKLFRLAVNRGTARKAEIQGYFIGGKTGTANKSSNNGGYNKNVRISSFFGIIPASKPKYAIYIMVDEPKGNKDTMGYATGGWVAVPAAKNIFEKMVALYALEEEDILSDDVQNLINIDYKINNEV